MFAAAHVRQVASVTEDSGVIAARSEIAWQEAVQEQIGEARRHTLGGEVGVLLAKQERLEEAICDHEVAQCCGDDLGIDRAKAARSDRGLETVSDATKPLRRERFTQPGKQRGVLLSDLHHHAPDRVRWPCRAWLQTF